MRVRLAFLTLSLCLAALPCSRDGRAAAQVSSWNDSPADSTGWWHGFEVGATFSVPTPRVSASRDELGLDLGVCSTAMLTPNFGAGLDVAYHYWPVSGAFKETFNERLRNGTLNTLELGGTTWRLTSLQVSGHLKLAAPTEWVMCPWLQVGAGTYRLDPNTTGYSGDAGFFTVTVGPFRSTSHLGYHFAAGVDCPTRLHTRFGLTASYHRVMCGEVYGSDLSIFSIGGHLLFGWAPGASTR